MNTIKELRKSKNLTQMQLAEILGIDQTAVSKWELNKALPDTGTAIKLSEYFDVSLDYLLGRSTFFYPDSVKKPTLPALADDEAELVALYRSLLPDYKTLALTNLRTWACKKSIKNSFTNRA